MMEITKVMEKQNWWMITLPNTKLSGLNICPKGPERTESIVPGSRSTKMAREHISHLNKKMDTIGHTNQYNLFSVWKQISVHICLKIWDRNVGILHN